jgi:hypothetical protein
MTNANTQISRKTVPARHAQHVEDTAQIDAVFTASIEDVLAHHARAVAAERARLERENAAMRAQIDSVFASL